VIVSLDRADAGVPAFLADLEALVTLESPSNSPELLLRSAEAIALLGERYLGQRPDTIDAGSTTHLRWRLGSGPRRILILTHHDTVWPEGTLATIPWSAHHGVIRGPGCFDMKFGIVQALAALAALPDELRDGVTLLVTGDEEIGSPSSRQLIEDEAQGCVAALVLESAGPGGALKTARKGVANYELVAEGRAAHAGLEPERGVNAAVEIAHQVLSLAAVGDAAQGTTVTPTVVAAGTTSNTVPASARVSIDSRATSIAEQVRVDAALRRLAPALPGSALRLDGGINRPPLEASRSVGLALLAAEVAVELGIPVPGTIAVGGASDGNFTAALGVDTLDGLGAVGGGAHAADEHVVMACIAERVALLAGLIERLAAEES